METGKRFRILIADRNRHVRQFLHRELESEGFEITEARDGRELASSLHGDTPPDLLVLDPELPFLTSTLDAVIQTESGDIPTLIHALAENMDQPSPKAGTVVVEKAGDIDRLKRAIMDSLRTRYPQEFAQAARQGGF